MQFRSLYLPFLQLIDKTILYYPSGIKQTSYNSVIYNFLPYFNSYFFIIYWTIKLLSLYRITIKSTPKHLYPFTTCSVVTFAVPFRVKNKKRKTLSEIEGRTPVNCRTTGQSYSNFSERHHSFEVKRSSKHLHVARKL